MSLLGALLATNQPQAVSNVIQQQTGMSVMVAAGPLEQELRNLMAADDAAHDEVNDWMSTNRISATNVTEQAAFNRRILSRFNLVRSGYETFLRNHPDHARGYLAFGSFLNDLGDEDGAKAQYENSRQLDPKNPAVWNQLANYYGEHGGLTNAFADYTEAIRLEPAEPVYYQNFATTVYLYRKDAREFYGLTESQVFDKALGLYRQAMRLAPDNFVLATDYAESYYGIRPLRTNDALLAWTNALHVAHTESERQGVGIHLARVKIAAGLYGEARKQLEDVTNSGYAELKGRLLRSLAEHERLATNTVAAGPADSAAVSEVLAVGPSGVSAAAGQLPSPTNPPVTLKRLEMQASPPALRGQSP